MKMTKNAEIIQNPNYTFSVWVENTLVSDGWKRRSDAEAEAEAEIANASSKTAEEVPA